jgi:hypothetical protein
MMKANNKGWDYCGNAQASVDEAFQIIVACEVSDAANDKQQGVPVAQATLENLQQAGITLPQDADGQEQKIPATLDSGYYSEEAAKAMEELGFDPYIATGRQRHHAPTEEPAPAAPGAAATPSPTATAQAPAAPGAAKAASPTATAKEKMAAKLRTPTGRALYARRKVIVEPVFGQIKGVRGFRRFLLRGLARVRGEWRLVCLTHNLLKIWRYRCAPSGT